MGTNVLNHIQTAHSSHPSPLLNKKQFKCTECDYTNLINDYVVKHMKTAHPKQYKCGECEFTSFLEENVIKHLQETHVMKKPENVVSDISDEKILDNEKKEIETSKLRAALGLPPM